MIQLLRHQVLILLAHGRYDFALCLQGRHPVAVCVLEWGNHYCHVLLLSTARGCTKSNLWLPIDRYGIDWYLYAFFPWEFASGRSTLSDSSTEITPLLSYRINRFPGTCVFERRSSKC